MTVVFRDKGLVELSQKMRELAAFKVVIGFPSSSTGSEIHPESKLTYAELGAIMEYGSPSRKIPARPFLRSTFEVHRAEIEAEIATQTKAVILGKATPLEAKIKIAKFTQRLVRFRFLQARKWAAPLAASTVKRKGHDTPLTDTRALGLALRWAVHKGGQALAGGRT